MDVWWLGIAMEACIVLASMLIWRMSIRQVQVVPAAPEARDESPELVLRLQEPLAHSGPDAPRDPAGAISRCMAARPGMRLRVRVELHEGAEQVWSGVYAASLQNARAGEAGGDDQTGCARLLKAAR
jgi:hypothetical protein